MTVRNRVFLGILSVSLFSLAPAAFAASKAGAWPIKFTRTPASDANFKGKASHEPVHDCQPESFDPKTNTYHLFTPKAVHAASGTAAASGAAAAKPAASALKVYQLDGAEPDETMTIDGRVNPGDAKIELADPLTVTRYFFTCHTGSSEALVFHYAGGRRAIFTHIAQSSFSPDREKLVMFNVGKLTHHGAWQKMRAVFVIKNRDFAPLPVSDATSFLGTVDNQHFLTYGLGKGGSAVVWNMHGSAVKALSLPLRATADGKGTADIIGLLPGESSTFYQLTRSDRGICTLRLQDLRKPRNHRALVLMVPGAITDDADLHKLVQLDLTGLSLKGGSVKYRTVDGKGGWSGWQTAK